MNFTLVTESMCLSPQDKLRSYGPLGLVHRKKQFAHTSDDEISECKEVDGQIASENETWNDSTDESTNGWVSDENLRSLDIDESFNHDIDWVKDDDIKTSLLTMNDGAEMDNADFALYLSPLRHSFSFYEEGMETNSSLHEPTHSDMIGASKAEKLLMSFETMHFTIPSPTSSGGKSSLQCTENRNSEMDIHTTSADSVLDYVGRDKFSPTRSHTCASSSNDSDSRKRIGSYSPEARRLRIHRFHEKRKNRTWKKSIKYDCRKKLADDRPRIKGRFVRVAENRTIRCDSGSSTDDTIVMMLMPSELQSPQSFCSSPEDVDNEENGIDQDLPELIATDLDAKKKMLNRVLFEIFVIGLLRSYTTIRQERILIAQHTTYPASTILEQWFLVEPNLIAINRRISDISYHLHKLCCSQYTFSELLNNFKMLIMIMNLKNLWLIQRADMQVDLLSSRYGQELDSQQSTLTKSCQWVHDILESFKAYLLWIIMMILFKVVRIEYKYMLSRSCIVVGPLAGYSQLGSLHLTFLPFYPNAFHTALYVEFFDFYCDRKIVWTINDTVWLHPSIVSFDCNNTLVLAEKLRIGKLLVGLQRELMMALTSLQEY
uniref:AlNc14C577G12199 protein n=1 Tax=Albugo laibachii Nc14 TaxID=890382 RepID=F0X1A5_9STRA|nr:AlNc14C577G12199 [Albugo laibachii Nc14]|eukprot:CCA27573.1 AlNc14C577G12199 [Albugo laibachii Nc14]